MRLKKYALTSAPKDGDFKIIYPFAWWPKRVEDNLIWLERYQRAFKYAVKERVAYYPGVLITFKGVWGKWDCLGEILKENSFDLKTHLNAP